MEKIDMIPLEWLGHHPDNPRKDLGDLTELAESIKANGILQNLTIVASDEENEGDGKYHQFWVVIGNRRMEAAKIAGLTEVPCVLSEMDHKTQVATMLQENMQRQDLTVYEQAEGFQMMMDLGFTEKQIAEKTGFSQKTVKDRIKLTKLNKKNFSKAVNQGATLMDLIEVTKLTSKTKQNEVMKAAGTENFRQRLLMALSEQTYNENKARLEPVLNEQMKELPEGERYNSKWERFWNKEFGMNGTADQLRKHMEKVIHGEEGDFRYLFSTYYNNGGEIEFFKKKAEKALFAEEKTARQIAIAQGKHRRLVESYWAQAYELRKDFIKNYSMASGASASTIGKILIRYALSEQQSYDGRLKKTHEWDDKYIRDVLGLPEEVLNDPGYEADPNKPWDKRYLSIWEQIDGNANVSMIRAILAWMVGGGVFWPDAPLHGLYDSHDGHYAAKSYQANGVIELYEFLKEIGYQMSDMEKQLMDGTHECYKMEEI